MFLYKHEDGVCLIAYQAKRNQKPIIRGGVEDTRLEAKAKDTKKSEAKDSLSENRTSRGQGQECSRPRTQAQAFFKKTKNGLQKFFSGDLQFIGVARILDCGRPKPQIT